MAKLRRRCGRLGTVGILLACLGGACSADGGFPMSMPDDGSGRDDGVDVTEPDVPDDVAEPDGTEVPAEADVPVEPDGSPDELDVADVEPPPPVPIADIDDLRLYINLGDSLAAGYNATGRNGSGGHGYARLMLDNHSDYPEYDGHFLRALYPDVRFVDLGESGATTSDALANLRSALGGTLPASVDGDVLVSLTCGGNDFNDDITTIILRAATEAAAARLQGNYREIFRLLRERYEDAAAGHVVVFLVTNVHDPTGGTGAIPPGFDAGFCATINNPRLVPLRAVAIGNLAFYDTAIADVVAELRGWLVDNHAVFFDHGMNAGAERWLSDDCVHPTDEGHHQLRREEWLMLTGERF